jgi:SAM-dependent methyltransferase
MKPAEIQLGEVLTFMTRNLPRPGARLLEVGCGRGDLAMRLLAAGNRVTAIDEDPDNVTDAKRAGVDARQAEWPEYADRPFDAVLFTRSLHHMPDIDAALARAAELINDGGRLLIDEFAYDAMDIATCRWFGKAVDALVEGQLLSLDDNSFVREFRQSGWDLYWWRRDHEPRVAPLGEMREALTSRFRIVQEQRVAYLYRHLVRVLPSSDPAGKILQRTLEAETRLGAAGEVVLLGWRVVAEPRAED